MKKKTIIAIIAAALILAAVLVIILVSGRNKEIKSSDTDSKYEYSYVRTKKGLKIVIQNGEEGYEWQVSKCNRNIVVPEEAKAEKGKTAFLLKPHVDGMTTIAFSLVNSENYYDELYRLIIGASVKDGVVSITSNTHTEMNGTIEDENGRYIIIQTDIQSFRIRMNYAENSTWKTKIESGSVDFDEVDPYGAGIMIKEENGTEVTDNIFPTVFDVTMRTYENAVIYIYNIYQPEALKVEIECSDNGDFKIASHAMVEYETVTVREWTLPDGAQLNGRGKDNLNGREGNSLGKADWVIFTFNERKWFLYSSDKIKLSDNKEAYFGSSDLFEKDGKTCAKFDTAFICAWDAENGYSYYLSTAGEIDEEAIMADIKTISEAIEK